MKALLFPLLLAAAVSQDSADCKQREAGGFTGFVIGMVSLITMCCVLSGWIMKKAKEHYKGQGGPSKEEYDKSVGTWGGVVFFANLVVLGAIVGGVGHKHMGAAACLLPEVDFRPVDGGCLVTKVDHATVTRGGQGSKCFDQYTYTFVTAKPCADFDPGVAPSISCGPDAAEPKTYTSRAEEHDRGGGACTEPQNPALLGVGGAAPCWAPAAVPVADEAAYRCSNPECVKLFSPAVEAEALGGSGGTMLLAGVIMVCVGPVLVLLLAAGAYKLGK